jgi:4-diphosphocytidyl-2-C-methyl-D-erythritol kinase
MTRPPLPSLHRLTCGCKVNLFLKIGNKLPGGYHALESLFLPLPAPSDTLEITVCSTGDPHGRIRVDCDTPGIDPARNTLVAAHALYAKAAAFAPTLSVCLKKGIPHGAGLGGGSADAACLLIFLQALADGSGRAGLSPMSLARVGAQVGADVPFFLLNQPALVRGTGELLEPVSPPCSGMYLVLVCPDLIISTAWAFSLLDAARAKEKSPSGEDLTRNGLQATTPSFTQRMTLENDFEAVIFPAFPLLAKICGELRREGA